MAIDIAIPRSRRSLLAGAAGGVAAALGASLAGAQRVLGAGNDGAIVHVGDQLLDVRTETLLINNTNSNSVLEGVNNQDGIGVLGYSFGGHGVQGGTANGTGVHGSSLHEGGYGVHGVAETLTGFTVGVRGEASSPAGIAMLASNAASTGPSQGVRGTTNSPKGWAAVGYAGKGGTGLVGVSDSGGNVPDSRIPNRTGVVGYAVDGRGGAFHGPTAQVRLIPTGAATHPAKGAKGDLFVDKNGHLWFCKGGSTWKQLA